MGEGSEGTECILSQLGASTMCLTEGLCNSELGHSKPYQVTKVQSATQVIQISKTLHKLAQRTQFSGKKSYCPQHKNILLVF